MKIQVRISRQCEEILKKLKRNCRGVFIDDAITHFARTPEGREKIERWKKEDSTVDSQLQAKDKEDSRKENLYLKSLNGFFGEE
ncbi:MAG: hypothetical protein QXG44_11865 [Candidatus Jordarchaeaceae archaeon]